MRRPEPALYALLLLPLVLLLASCAPRAVGVRTESHQQLQQDLSVRGQAVTSNHSGNDVCGVTKPLGCWRRLLGWLQGDVGPTSAGTSTAPHEAQQAQEAQEAQQAQRLVDAPDAPEEAPDAAVTALLAENQTCDDEPLPKGGIRVLSYNLCWGCLEQSSHDRTGMRDDLLKNCMRTAAAEHQLTDTSALKDDENWMGTNVSLCAFQLGETVRLLSADIGGYDIMGFQEASNFDNLRLKPHFAAYEAVKHGVDLEFSHPRFPDKKKKAWVVTFYNRTKFGLHDLAFGGREPNCDSARPYQVLVFDKAQIVVINLHHCNGRTRSEVDNGFQLAVWEHLNLLANDGNRDLASYRFIMTGDFNDRLHVYDDGIVMGTALARFATSAPSCCTTTAKAQLPAMNNRPGDYIMDSASKPHLRIPCRYRDTGCMSDHRPVEAYLP